MFQACRPAGRLFYWVLALVVTASSALGSTREEASAGKPAASPTPQDGPPMTSIVEVREHDYGWGQANDRNLLGRFSTQTFNLPRLARTQNYLLRLYDGSSPPKYSRYSAALHIDYPL
jgi:hypothetical protein